MANSPLRSHSEPLEILDLTNGYLPLNNHSEPLENIFDLSDGKLTIRGEPLLTQVPQNVSFSPFSSICHSSESDAPPSLLQNVLDMSHNGGFLGFFQEEPSDRLMNSLGRFTGRDFLSIFRFKTWWSTQWVGNSGSDLQMETQWAMLDVPEIKSYAIIIPIIEGSFRSALHPGTDGHVMICAESGSTQVKASSFNAIAYVHVSENPYFLMTQAFSALRVHLNTFKLLEEKTLPNLVDKFGWCTWDAFYLTVDPIGVWHGLNDFAKGGVAPRFLIIDDGWQSINLDGDDPNEDTKNLTVGGKQMAARIYRFEECDKFKKYKAGLMLGPNAPSFDPKKTEMLLAKGVELERLKNRMEGIDERPNLSETELMRVKQLEQEIEDLFGEVRRTKCGGSCCKTEDSGMKAFTKDLRTKFKALDDIYVWHALCGAWGGVRPGSTHLNSKIVPCKLSPGLDGTMNDLAVVNIVKGSIGLVHPHQAHDLYDSMHSYLAKCGITGVKVDVMHTLEYVCDEYGGRVDLAKAYYNGLTNSMVKNFNGSGVIASMQQCNDFFFLGTKQIAMGRVGDDFWVSDPKDPMGSFWLQGVHIIHCAYNSLWMGQMIQPDWDMFYSVHDCAKFHAASRAICGGPVYLSDQVGSHNFDIINMLVYPDGTIPKCINLALPTRDCLFKNPLFDHKTLLKIWNLNKYGGVIGVFNCQGAGWDPETRIIRGFPECYKSVSGTIHVSDVEWNQKQETAYLGVAEEYAVYQSETMKLNIMSRNSEKIPITMQPSTFEIFSFVPVRELNVGVKFAPIGLTNMLNCGGSIQEIYYVEHRDDNGVKVKVKGGGNFVAYSSEIPRMCLVNGEDVPFHWVPEGKLTIQLPWIEHAGGISNLSFYY